MTAIYKRELKSYFYSMTGWLFLAANVFLSGLYFFALNLRYGYASMANTVIIFCFYCLLRCRSSPCGRWQMREGKKRIS